MIVEIQKVIIHLVRTNYRGISVMTRCNIKYEILGSISYFWLTEGTFFHHCVVVIIPFLKPMAISLHVNRARGTISKFLEM